MTTKFYLKVNSHGVVNTTKSMPGLRFDEVAILVNVELPDILFRKPQITASISVGTDNVTPFTIDAITVDNVRGAIEAATGMQVKLSIEQAVA